MTAEHRITVMSQRKVRRAVFYAVCSCGQLHGRSRTSASSAERDGRSHALWADIDETNEREAARHG